MSAFRQWILAVAVSASIVPACAAAGRDDCPPVEEEPDAGQPPSPALTTRPPLPSLKELGADARRMALVILPSDAAVEVDGVPARRRDGAVDIVGKPGERRRVRVSRGSWWTEEVVTIPDAPGPPKEIKVTPPPVRPVGGVAPAGAKTPEGSGNPLVPNDPLVPASPDGL